MPAFLIPLLPYIFKTAIATLGAIAVDIFRRKANVEKTERKMISAKKALDRIDQIIVGTVGAIHVYQNAHNLKKEDTDKTIKVIINNSIPDDLRKQADKAVNNLDSYILRGIENAQLNIELNKKGGEK